MKKPNKLLKGSALLIILGLTLVIGPGLFVCRANAISSYNTTYVPLENFATKYLAIFGYNSPQIGEFSVNTTAAVQSGAGSYSVIENGTATTMNIESSLQTLNDGVQGYIYSAEFISGSERYSVIEENSTTVNGNQATSTLSMRITGSMNYDFSDAENQTTTGTFLTRHDASQINFSNSSGSYYLLINDTGILSSINSTLLNATITVDQNIFAPAGQYVINLTPATNGFGLAAAVQLPGGAAAPSDWVLGVDQYSNDWWWSGSNEYFVGGWYVYWSPSAWPTVQAIVEALGEVVDLYLYPVGITASVIADILLGVGQSEYMSDMDGGMTIMFLDAYIEYAGGWDPIPLYGDCGYYTDYLGGYPGGQYVGWTYYTLFSV